MAQLMKGETFKDALKLVRGKPRFEYPVMVEVKADEIRCQVVRRLPGVVEFLSYAGKPLHNLDFLAGQFELLFSHMGYWELDVGILVNGNFNDSYRWVRSSKGAPKELDRGMVEVIVFDLPQNRKPFMDRMIDIDFAAQGLRHYGMNATRPARQLCASEAEVWAVYRGFREQGYEGAMAKTMQHEYARRRTFDWMKVKPSDDIDGMIIVFNEAHSEAGEPLGRVGSVTVRMEDGSEASPAGFDHELGRDIWQNQLQYLGQWLTFNYMERDRQGGYRHPHFERFREAKV